MSNFEPGTRVPSHVMLELSQAFERIKHVHGAPALASFLRELANNPERDAEQVLQSVVSGIASSSDRESVLCVDPYADSGLSLGTIGKKEGDIPEFSLDDVSGMRAPDEDTNDIIIMGEEEDDVALAGDSGVMLWVGDDLVLPVEARESSQAQGGYRISPLPHDSGQSDVLLEVEGADGSQAPAPKPQLGFLDRISKLLKLQ